MARNETKCYRYQPIRHYGIIGDCHIAILGTQAAAAGHGRAGLSSLRSISLADPNHSSGTPRASCIQKGSVWIRDNF